MKRLIQAAFCAALLVIATAIHAHPHPGGNQRAAALSQLHQCKQEMRSCESRAEQEARRAAPTLEALREARSTGRDYETKWEGCCSQLESCVDIVSSLDSGVADEFNRGDKDDFCGYEGGKRRGWVEHAIMRDAERETNRRINNR